MICQGCIAQTNHRIRVIQEAEKLLGKEYRYAGRGPDHFDCSGLVSKVYENVNIRIRGSSQSMSQSHRGIKLSKAKGGDLIFFKKEGSVFHVSIISAVGEGEIEVIHSTSSRGVIKENILALPYWEEKIYKVISLAALK